MTDEINPMAPATDVPAAEPMTEPTADPIIPAPAPEAPAEGETPTV